MKLANFKKTSTQTLIRLLESGNAEHQTSPTNFYITEPKQECQQSYVQVNMDLCVSLEDEAATKLALT